MKIIKENNSLLLRKLLLFLSKQEAFSTKTAIKIEEIEEALQINIKSIIENNSILIIKYDNYIYLNYKLYKYYQRNYYLSLFCLLLYIAILISLTYILMKLTL